jgi:lipopolysaccharide export LptBFGC system permease protein LptF
VSLRTIVLIVLAIFLFLTILTVVLGNTLTAA